MNVKTYFLDKENRKALTTLDNWLATKPMDSPIDFETLHKIREMITSIEDKGYYTQDERDILNGARDYWYNQKYGGQWVCRYCLKSTKDVEYDYLSGQDHLECQLKEEIK